MLMLDKDFLSLFYNILEYIKKDLMQMPLEQ